MRLSTLLAAAAALAGLVLAGCSEDPAVTPGVDRGTAPLADGRPADARPGERAPDEARVADALAGDSGAGTTCSAPTNRALRIFFIGNSFTLGGPIPTLVGALASSAGFPTPTVSYSAVGGYTLAQHRSLAASTSGVAAGSWDFVVLQEYSTRPTDNAGDPLGFKKDATWFYDQTKVASPKALVVLYETWARHPDHSIYPNTFTNPAQMQAQLRYHYRDAADSYIPKNAQSAVKTDAKVAPAGDAWEKHLAGANPLRLHASDDYHAGVNGQYLNALVLYSTLFGCKATGLSSLSLSVADSARLQATADATTGITGVPPGSTIKPLPVGTAIRIDFGTVQTTASGWNNAATASGSLADAVTTAGQVTSMDVIITDAFSGTNESGRTDNTLGWPPTVSQDTLWAGSFDGHTAALGQPARLELQGLPAGTYTVAIFASRAGKDGSLDRLGRYTIGGTWQDLDATDNQSKQVVFSNLAVGSSGKVVLDVAVSPAGTARFGYLGALTITRTK